MNIIYLNTTEKGPSGGANIIYKHSEIINNLKIKNVKSEVLHLKKKKISKIKNSIKKIFRITQSAGWKFSDVTICKNRKSKWIDNSTQIRNKFNFDPKNDFVIIPEIWAHFANDLLIKNKINYAIFVQNGYAMNFTSDHKNLFKSYKNSKFILSYSRNISKCVTTAFGINENKILKTNVSIKSVNKFKKKNIITFMPRKLAEHSNNLLFFIKSKIPKNWSIKPISQLNQNETFALLKRSRIFLSFSNLEGLGLPPLEAAILGNKVIGYTGQGGKEYWKSPLFEKIETGNILKFCKMILKNINLINDSWVKKTLKIRQKLIYKYSPEQEKVKILKMVQIISKILNIKLKIKKNNSIII